MSTDLSFLMGNVGWLWNQCRGIGTNLEFICGTQISLLCCCSDLRVPLHVWYCSWRLSGVPSKKSSILSYLMWNTELLCMQCRGIGPHLGLIWGTLSSFLLLLGPQLPSRRVIVFVGTLWSSIKEVNAPFLFDREHGIALHTVQGNWASSSDEGTSHGFS